MRRLFAPWRMEFILAGGAPAHVCIFCAFPAEVEAHRRNLILAVQPQAFVMLNKFPYNPGHLMVIPRRHVARPDQLAPEEWAATSELLRRTIGVLGDALGTADFNVGINVGRAAGAGIDAHVHVHVVPRWPGDNNFMPVIGETKVLPEALERTYDKLRPVFAPLEAP